MAFKEALLHIRHGHYACFGGGENIIRLHGLHKRRVFFLGRKRPRAQDIRFTITKNAAGSCIAIEFHFVRCFHAYIIT